MKPSWRHQQCHKHGNINSTSLYALNQQKKITIVLAHHSAALMLQLVNKLQLVQNAAARGLTRNQKTWPDLIHTALTLNQISHSIMVSHRSTWVSFWSFMISHAYVNKKVQSLINRSNSQGCCRGHSFIFQNVKVRKQPSNKCSGFRHSLCVVMPSVKFFIGK